MAWCVALASLLATCLGVAIAYLVFAYCLADRTFYLRAQARAEALEQLAIPKVVMQTHYDLASLPAKVAQQFEVYGRGFQRELFDDPAARAFIERHFSSDLVRSFDALPVGAHKADFFRYCYLFVRGGVYLDVKTQLVRPLQDIYEALQQEGSSMATCLTSRCFLPHTWFEPCAYQGIIFARPRHPIFLECLEFMRAYGWRSRLNYFVFVQNFSKRLRERGMRAPGVHRSQGWTLWQEKVSLGLSGCHGERSKMWVCSSIVHPGSQQLLFQTRFADYPWKKRKGVLF